VRRASSPAVGPPPASLQEAELALGVSLLVADAAGHPGHLWDRHRKRAVDRLSGSAAGSATAAIHRYFGIRNERAGLKTITVCFIAVSKRGSKKRGAAPTSSRSR
jgi:hypothetical protein